MLFSSILAVAKSKSSFYLSAVWYSIMQMYHSFGIHSFSEGHLGCFQHLAIVKCVARNFGVHKLFRIGVSGFLRYNHGNRIARPKGISIFSFLKKFSTEVAPSLHSHQQWTRFLFSPQLCQYFFCWFVYDVHSDQCEVVSHCGFNFYLSDG